MRLLPLLLCMTALPLLAQDDKKEEDAKPKGPLDGKAGDVEIGDPGVVISDSAVANAEVARFQADMKKAKRAKDEKQMAELLLLLGAKDHPKIYLAATKHVKHKNHRVATAAVICIARQQSSAKKARRYLQGILKREKRTSVVAAAIVGMGVLNHTGAYKDVKKVFVKDRRELRKAAARYFGYTKAKDAFRLLAEQLDQPEPANPNDPDNPPASYWEERYYEWKENEKAVHWALSQLVEGESFETEREAKQWAEQNGRKHGIEW